MLNSLPNTHSLERFILKQKEKVSPIMRYDEIRINGDRVDQDALNRLSLSYENSKLGTSPTEPRWLPGPPSEQACVSEGTPNRAPQQASRHNAGKPRMSLIPPDALLEEAAVWTRGAVKYGEGNWEKLWGDKTVSVCLDSLMRHTAAIQSGEVYDPETGLQHAAHIRCNAAMLIRHFRFSGRALTEQTLEPVSR